MPTNYDGVPGNIAFPTALAITGVTNVNPMVVTVSGSLPADFLSGVEVDITGVLGCNAANGQWPATVTGASTFSIPAAGNGAYASGGSVQQLNNTPFYQSPSDGDAAIEASIDSWMRTTGDRTQLLASVTGAYKMRSHEVIQAVSDGGAAPPQIPTNWAKNASIANAYVQMVTPGNAPIIFQIPNFLAGDVAEVTLQTTLSLSGASGVGTCVIGMAYSFGPYAAPPLPTSSLTYFNVHAKYTGAGITDLYPLSWANKIVAPNTYTDGTLSGIAFVTFWAHTYGVNMAINLCGDSQIFSRCYRPTFFPQ
jgi:hypothetical protein